MKFFITGGAGMLGSQLIKQLKSQGHQVVATFLNHPILTECKSYMVDICKSKIIGLIKAEQPDVIVNCAAVTNVDLCEKNKLLARRVNVEAVRNLIEGAKVVNAKFVQLSSIFVYDGGEGLVEDSYLKGVNFYAETKIAAEGLVKSSGLDYLIARTDQVFSWHPFRTNFVKYVLSKLDKGYPFPIFSDWINQPTYAPNLASMIIDLVLKGEVGVFNVTGDSVVSRFEWAKLIARVFGKDESLVLEGHSSKVSSLVPRPNCSVSLNKLKSVGVKSLSLNESLLLMRDWRSANPVKKAVILAGGTGTRLSPATQVANKHLCLVYDRPMIYYPLQRLIDVGVEKVLIVSGGDHLSGFIDLFHSGKEFGLDISYKVQDEAGGIAQALALAQDFVGGDNFVVILGDNYFGEDLRDHFLGFDRGARIILKEVSDPERFGVANLVDGEINKIIEKPLCPESNLAVTGCYLYDSNVFDIVKTLEPSGRGELEITDVNNAYLERGELDYSITQGFWTDMGKPDSLLKAANFINESIN